MEETNRNLLCCPKEKSFSRIASSTNSCVLTLFQRKTTVQAENVLSYLKNMLRWFALWSGISF
jgi:hypothetical protein